MILLLLLIVMSTQPALAQEPDWTRLPPTKIGSQVTVSCHGLGPDRDLAIRLATDQCRSLATERLDSTFNVNTMSVETEQMAAFHQEVTGKHKVAGLVCDVQKQFEEHIDGSVSAWLQCKFDTRIVKIVLDTPQTFVVQDKSVNISDETLVPKKIVQSQNKQLIVSSVPHCQSVLISGKLTRVVRCESNPQILTIDYLDKEIIVRAEGYQPKHVKLDGDRAVATETQTLEVYLEK